MADVEPVSRCQLPEVRGQLVGLWHPRTVQEDRDYRNIALQRGCDLDAHEVMRIIKAAVSIVVARVEPIWANQSDQCITLRDLLAQNPNEVRAERNSVNVHEQEIAAELLRESVVNAPGVARALVTTIADKNCQFATSSRLIATLADLLSTPAAASFTR
jgi:hypothetical protein